jgi:hypothetical protein
MPQRSAVSIWSMSPGSVDSSSTPHVARTRCTGTATETTSWCFWSTRTMALESPVSAAATSG